MLAAVRSYPFLAGISITSKDRDEDGRIKSWKVYCKRKNCRLCFRVITDNNLCPEIKENAFQKAFHTCELSSPTIYEVPMEALEEFHAANESQTDSPHTVYQPGSNHTNQSVFNQPGSVHRNVSSQPYCNGQVNQSTASQPYSASNGQVYQSVASQQHHPGNGQVNQSVASQQYHPGNGQVNLSVASQPYCPGNGQVNQSVASQPYSAGNGQVIQSVASQCYSAGNGQVNQSVASQPYHP